HDLGCARLAASDEFLGVLAHPLLEGLIWFWRRQKTFIGARRARQPNAKRLVVGFVDIDDGAVGNVWFFRPAGLFPILKELDVTRRSIRARINQKVAGVD